MKSPLVQPPPQSPPHQQPPPPPPPPPPPRRPLLEHAVPFLIDRGSTSDPPPPEKKQKLNEEDNDNEDSMSSFGSDVDIVTDWKEVSGDEYDSEEDYCPDYPLQKTRDHALWERYYQQIKDSDGFDIKDYPGSCPMATIYPLQWFLENPKNYDMVKGYAERALEVYNAEKGTDYAVVNVLKLNGGGCKYYDFYITFSVKTRDNKENWFQVKVVRDLRDNLEFPIIRPRPKKDLDI